MTGTTDHGHDEERGGREARNARFDHTTGNAAPIVEGRGLTRMFAMPAGAVTALGDVSMSVDPGDYVAITGPSGCGKSTLLHILGCVDRPSAGSLVFEGRDVNALTESERSRIRLTRIGFEIGRAHV